MILMVTNYQSSFKIIKDKGGETENIDHSNTIGKLIDLIYTFW